ncbi:circularly permuted type 2 ATP-grasp protein [Terrarubrum flagellatum]|uniref:circularly permuted type 2 ATP-grasp protein n=1 Tax=Terrirubrum flagellatum TaxID=2895980 RepID=UPI0031450693
MSAVSPAARKETETRRERIRALMSGYRPLRGVPDELLGPDGQPRAHWMRFLDGLLTLPPQDIERRFDASDQHIRDSGVSYRTWSDSGDPLINERAWPLSHVPLVLPEAEWKAIEAGVAQRAQLLEALLADIYGEGKLIADGSLPAAAVTGSAEFLRPMHGVKPQGGRYLGLYAADLGRGPDGRWWVLGDRTQAPSGAGYALENRVALSRAFPELYREMNVERLAPFFRGLHTGLASMGRRAEPRICLLTPGPLSATYFEHAYLARYLGLLLVEGGDLVVRQGQVHIRTIAGLKRADVILRRIDADYADPLELNANSQLGVPGLMEAVRAGSVALANALGSGVLESNALMSFMPSLSQALIGEDLLLPNIATWWCGQERERRAVLDRLDEMAIAGAFSPGVPGFSGGEPVIAGALDAEQRAKLARAIDERGIDLVGQEIVHLSTMPTWQDGALTPRPFVLRVFAAATPDGWKVMPGGFCRISDQRDARAVSMGDGVQSADVWILADKPVEQMSLLPTAENVRIRRIMGNLPSRAADNMFWLGRYLERTEATLRVIRCMAGQLIESGADRDAPKRAPQKLAELLTAWGALPEKKTHTATAALALSALQSGADYGSALSLSRAARRAASVVRERLSLDAWQLLHQLQERLEQPAPAGISEAEIFDRARGALHVMSALSGLTQENMNRVAGWRFLDVGRRIERAVNTCRFVRQFSAENAPSSDLDALLDLCDCQITYRQRYLAGLAIAPVRDLAILDPYNPRSVAFQVDRLDEHLAVLPALYDDGMLEPQRRIVSRLAAELQTTEARNLDHMAILAFEQNLLSLSDAVSTRYFLQGPHAARAGQVTGLA